MVIIKAILIFYDFLSISKPELAILCGGLLRLWETPASFARKYYYDFNS